MTEVKIAKIISNGCGIGWAEGKTFFVPYTLPGETVKIKSAVKEKSFFYTDDFELLEASPERRKPLCSHYGICGGCSLQHASYPAQLRIKKSIFSELLKQNQITLEIDPIVITPGETGIRTRAKLFSFKGKPAYRKKRSSDFVQIESCPLEVGVAQDIEQAIIAKLNLSWVFGLVESIGIDEQRPTLDAINLFAHVLQIGPQANRSIRLHL